VFNTDIKFNQNPSRSFGDETRTVKQDKYDFPISVGHALEVTEFRVAGRKHLQVHNMT